MRVYIFHITMYFWWLIHTPTSMAPPGTSGHNIQIKQNDLKLIRGFLSCISYISSLQQPQETGSAVLDNTAMEYFHPCGKTYCIVLIIDYGGWKCAIHVCILQLLCACCFFLCYFCVRFEHRVFSVCVLEFLCVSVYGL